MIENPSTSEAGSSAGLVAAAGLGSRLGRGPKALLEVGGVTLLERAVSCLTAVVDEVLVAVPAELAAAATELVPAARIVAGGATRQETVRILATAACADLVLVHDVARPFLPEEVTRRVLRAARAGAATASLPVADTLVRAADGGVVERDGLRSVQTPQGFRRELLVEAHDAAASAGRTATDDAALVRALGVDVALVDGSPWLFKLTLPGDMAYAAALASIWDATSRGH